MCATLVNTPTQDMGPADLPAPCVRRASSMLRAIANGGDELREQFPTIHAVGRAAAADRQPRFATVHGADDAPHLVIVGKARVSTPAVST